jgi:predicted nucleic acid-binding protein
MLELLPQLFTRIHIADEIHREVVVLGTGRPAAAAVEAAPWIERHGPADAAALASLRALHPLGSGELATLLLAQSLGADLAIMTSAPPDAWPGLAESRSWAAWA